MPRTTNGSGTLYLRGDIWWVKLHIDGRPVYQTSKSTKKSDAIKLRDQLLAKKHRGEISGGAPDRVLIDELLDDLIKSDVKEATRYIGCGWPCCRGVDSERLRQVPGRRR